MQPEPQPPPQQPPPSYTHTPQYDRPAPQHTHTPQIQPPPQYTQPTTPPRQDPPTPQYTRPHTPPPVEQQTTQHTWHHSSPRYNQPQPQHAPPTPRYGQPAPQHPPIQPRQYTPPPQPAKRGTRPIFIVLSTIGVVFIVFTVLIVLILVFDDYPPAESEQFVTNTVATPAPLVNHGDTQVLTGAQIFAKNRDAVIIIRTTDSQGFYIGTGSGFIVCPTGIAVTNHHVMVDWDYATAILYDGREFNITGYFSYDFANDLAIIQVDGRGASFDYVTLGNSDNVSVGENVFAIGGPDWDPITFTPGMVSRIVYEHIPFGIYSISGMFQSTAAIYGGNSGGPLVNDRGQVIGVNAAGNTARASVQFAVPANRINLPTPGSAANPLPMGGAPTASDLIPGQLFTYSRFPFIPDFLSTSVNASLLFGGTPENLGLSPGDIIYDLYTYMFMYDLPARYWIADTDIYDIVLMEHGFFFQNIVDFGSDIWVYFFHPEHNTSLSYAFMGDYDMLLVAIVEGNVYEAFYHGGAADTPNQAEVSHDNAVIGTWRFVETTDDFYSELMGRGETVSYFFQPGGTGRWNSVNERGIVTHEFSLSWHTANGVITINFPEINLLLTYDYFAEHDAMGYYMLFFGPGDTEHYFHLYNR
ncbi:MAG: trypsin-like peptidase domain-containing protein [Defluviitaleaceae bacterium]|nr:trypsin-like peptidase domain-containing protein [Defluviitaleaceae bacterium]